LIYDSNHNIVVPTGLSLNWASSKLESGIIILLKPNPQHFFKRRSEVVRKVPYVETLPAFQDKVNEVILK